MLDNYKNLLQKVKNHTRKHQNNSIILTYADDLPESKINNLNINENESLICTLELSALNKILITTESFIFQFHDKSEVMKIIDINSFDYDSDFKLDLETPKKISIKYRNSLDYQLLVDNAFELIPIINLLVKIKKVILNHTFNNNEG